MLSTLLHFGGQQRVAFVDFPDAIQHFGQFGRQSGLTRDLHDRLSVEPDLLHNFDVVRIVSAQHCGGLLD